MDHQDILRSPILMRVRVYLSISSDESNSNGNPSNIGKR